MDYTKFLSSASLVFVREFVEKIIFSGLGFKKSEASTAIIALVSTLLVLFVLWKLFLLIGRLIFRLAEIILDF